MPYSKTSELPASTKNLSPKQKKAYLHAFNAALAEYGKEDIAFAVAMAAAKKVHKSQFTSIKYLDLYITKAVIKDDVMIWNGTASDTGVDLFEERMSVELYKSFIDYFDNSEFVSLAHYPKLGGRAELGKVTSFYIDGEQLKSRGIFYDTRLGIAAYNAIRKDRRENTPEDNRIRLSIGFYDRKHSHGDGNIWSYKSDMPCMWCASGVKDKVYLEGKCDHVALTRKPARVTTSINVEEK